ncbi:ubiquinol oxidase subunit II [Sphingomonas sp.]|uniref:ubiquinol oxidase subunit II n=1 Tax=Sphingomonas sp. TaxID=28214 RepID=UPI0025E11033|nr:ubiquinol oxidase subunit II [Sphingomonas sp.]
MSRARAALVLALASGGCAPAAVLDPAGPVAAHERLILLDSLGIMLAIVVPTILATLAFAWWYRAGNARATYRPDWAYSGQLELLVWSVPALVVIFVGGIAWVSSHDLDPARPIAGAAPLDVQVVSLDWKWLFLYPGQNVASVNRLVVPTGRPVRLTLTSASVMNSFFVPRLGSQIYTMPGMATTLNLRADAPGRYRGLSANYSGKGFYGMQFAVDAVPAAQFDGWVGQARQAQAVLDVPAYRALLGDGERVAPATWRGVAPGLFDAIVRNAGTAKARPAVDGRSQ